MELAFETERCVIRDWRESDVDRYFDTYSRWEVARWLGSDPKALETRDQAATGIVRWAARNAADDVSGLWAVEVKETGVVAGSVLLVPLPDSEGDFEVGWHFHPGSWGHGYATEAGRAALSWGFAHALAEIFAVVRPDNAPSIAVCRRLGMEALGLTSTYYDAELELFRITPDGVQASNV